MVSYKPSKVNIYLSSNLRKALPKIKLLQKVLHVHTKWSLSEF